MDAAVNGSVPIRPASVYDVTLDGSRRETVLEDRLVDDWGLWWRICRIRFRMWPGSKQLS